MFTTPGDGADGDGLVFLSYSHDDTVWAQRFRVLLKPLVRRKRLTLWDDSQIRIGDEWHPAIEEAIGRSRVALVLVSPDSLASGYIMDRELSRSTIAVANTGRPTLLSLADPAELG